MYWRLIPVTDVLEAAESNDMVWPSVCHLPRGASPLLAWEFVRALLRHSDLERTTVKLAVLSDLAGPLVVAIVRHRGIGMWEAFTTPQMPISMILRIRDSDDLTLESLLSGLPGPAWWLRIQRYDERFHPPLDRHRPELRSITQLHVTTRVDGTGGFDTYWASRSPGLRRRIRTIDQRLQREGRSPQLVVLSTPEEVAAAIRTHGELERTGWKGRAGSSLAQQPADMRFYEDALSALSDVGAVRVFQLWFAERLAASQLTIEHADITVLLKTAYDEGLASYAPGRMLDHYMIRRIFEVRSSVSVEYSTKAIEEDRRWATEERPVARVDIFVHPLFRGAVSSLRRLRGVARERGTGAVFALPWVLAKRRWLRWRDGAFDRRHGIDTAGIIEPKDLDGIGPHAAHSTGHQPIQEHIFRRMMLRVRCATADASFIDFGSGKGRAVLLAAQQQFRRCVGVELSPQLAAIAENNLRRVCGQSWIHSPIELHCLDATKYQLPDGPLVCFFYNPFDGHVLELVLRNLLSAMKAQPRDLWLVYRNPVWKACIEKHAVFRLRYADRHCCIYQAQVGDDVAGVEPTFPP